MGHGELRGSWGNPEASVGTPYAQLGTSATRSRDMPPCGPWTFPWNLPSSGPTAQALCHGGSSGALTTYKGATGVTSHINRPASSSNVH